MPQAIYTAAKGLYESTDSGSGFSISGAPLIMQGQSVELEQIVYTLTFTGVTTVDDKESGLGLADGTTAYQNQTFVLYDGDGTAVTFGFTHADAGGDGVADDTHGANAISISEADNDAAIASAVDTAIKNYGSGDIFATSTTAAVVTVYVKKPGLLGAGPLAAVEAQSILDTILTGATTASFAVADAGATSRVAAYASADRANNNGAPTTNQIHGAGYSVVTLAQDNADSDTTIAFANGSDVGQEKFVENAGSTGNLIMTGAFQKASATDTAMTLAAGDTEWLIWNGSQWYLAMNNGTI